MGEGVTITEREAAERTASQPVQRACDRCTQGVMDAAGPNSPGNDHLYRRCRCSCHQPVAGRDYPCSDWRCPLPHVTRRCGPVLASYCRLEVKP